MKFKEVQKTVALMLMFLGLKKLPIKDGALDFSEEQKQKLKEAFGETINLENALEAVNKELADMAEGAITEEQRLIDAKQEIEDMLKEHGMSQEDLEKAKENENVDSDAVDQIKALITNYSKKMDDHLKKLMAAPEGDTPEAILKGNKNKDMGHSETHLMGDNSNPLNAFEGRAWNQMAAGQDVAMPTFAIGSTEVQKLKDDFELYNRETNSNIISLFRDSLKLPSFWRLRSNVDDRVADGRIVTAEITQARKKGWLPKNQQLIQPEEDKVYPAQVDIEHAGYWLQEQLTSWISQYNKEGSQAYRWTFVRFLNTEIDKRRAQEDRIVAVKGVHVKTPETTEIPGLAINRGDGVLIKLWRALHVTKKYKAAQIGVPTTSNIVDYVKALIESNVPEEEKNNPGLVYYLSPTWVRRHVERKRILFGHDNNYTGQELMEIENYPNVKLCPLVDMEGTDFMFITYDNNIELMENVPGERSMYHMESQKRQIYIFGDYKWGSRVMHIGTKVKDGDPAAFKVQTVWSNGLSPFKSDFYVRMYDDTTGEIALPYSNITITNDWATNIDTITGTYEGQVVRIKGNTGIADVKNVTDDGNITLTGDADFNLKLGGTLTLRANADGTLTEVKRTTEPAQAPDTTVEFSGPTLDANDGTDFKYIGGADAFEEILNGIEGQTIKITGTASGDLTINDVAGNINVASEAVVSDGDDISFTLIDGVWEEVERNIAV